MIEADALGQRRTGAASGVAAKYLARPGARSLGVIGCGWQAESQVEAIRGSRPHDRDASSPTAGRPRTARRRSARRRALSRPRASATPQRRTSSSPRPTSPDPVLRGEWLREGALVCAVGANDRRARELDDVVLERATFVCCDSREQARLESGDLIEPVASGVLDWLEVHELQEVVAGEVRGRERTPTSSSSSRTGSPPGTSPSELPRSSAPASAASAGSSRPSIVSARVGDRVVADRLDHLGPVEQPGALVRREAVLHVAVLQDLCEVAPAVVLADHVGGDALLGRRALEEEREEVPERHRARLYPPSCVATRPTGRCAERMLRGVDDAGREERVVIWVERKPGAVWAVGRAVNPQHRPSDEPRRDDWLFEGYELGDALDAANGALEDDVRVLEQDGAPGKVQAVHPQGGAAHARALLLRPPLRLAGRSAGCRALHRCRPTRLLRPLEVRVRDRVAVRIVGREAERPVDPRLELLRERVLEPVGLVVDVVDADPERLGEVELEQPVVADHLERHLLAVRA